MLEYKIILPEYDNAGASLLSVHEGLQKKLADIFGGFTMVSATGAWVNPEGHCDIEDIIIYTFACDGGDFHREQDITIEIWLECYAKALCADAQQQSVYIAIGSFAKIIEAEKCSHDWKTAPNTHGLIDACTKCGEERA